MTLIRRFQLWRLKRDVARLPVPMSDTDVLRNLWEYDQFTTLNGMAQDMQHRIQRFREIVLPKPLPPQPHE